MAEQIITERAKDNLSDAQILGGMLFEQFPCIASVEVCLDLASGNSITAKVTRNNMGAIVAIDNCNLPWKQ